ncbi:MAG: TonB-dependent receptor plug domain-containing protein [Burkholderiales bacterium]|nr:TonB-dependent receptor plug domain-containing protein [Burkholderiales bacterium]
MPIEHDKLPVAGCRLPFSLHAVAASVLLCASASAFASAEDEAELALAYGDKDFISLATGSKQLVSRAPAVATVITAQDIAATGARNVDEALQALPGMHVSVGYLYDPVYAVRGLHTKYNPEVLMLFNGVPITSPYFSNRGDGWNTMPAENIARIEVIRGPGSALYGADAFTGVINVITKTSADVGGTVVGSRLGSYNSREAWVQHGGHWGKVKWRPICRPAKPMAPTKPLPPTPKPPWTRPLLPAPAEPWPLATGGRNAQRSAGPILRCVALAHPVQPTIECTTGTRCGRCAGHPGALQYAALVDRFELHQRPVH